jgi:iron complex transport system substrate-binding protein
VSYPTPGRRPTRFLCGFAPRASILSTGRFVRANCGSSCVLSFHSSLSYEARLGDVAASVRGRWKPKVYFEEWDHPLISGIGWVSELIEIAGGEEVFPELRKQKAAKDRIVSPDDVIAAAPDIILASWCGKKVIPDKIRQRPGWDAIPAVRNCRIVEIKSALILQPGPAALTDGLDAILAALGRGK